MGRNSDYGNGMYQQFMEIMGRLETVEKDSTRKIENLNNRIDVLEKENLILKEENLLLKEDNARLKSIINNDSSNTSLPPSTDKKGGKPANTFNGRKETQRKPGGQKGHKGTTLTKAEIEKKIASGKCRHEIRTIGDSSRQNYVKKYVIDLKTEPVITEIRIYSDENGKIRIPSEYRSDVTYGTNVKALAVSLYSEGVMSNDRIASFLNAAGNGELELSEGSVYSFCKSFAKASEASILNLENLLMDQAVVATDATTVTVNGKQNYIRNLSIKDAVVYHAMNSKSIEALKELDFLKHYAGILLHDHETALYHFGTDHAECNVHIIRYLRKNTEETGNVWSDDMITLLCKMNRTRKDFMEQGASGLPVEKIREYEEKYFSLLEAGKTENKTTAHKYAKQEEKTLLNRMEKYSHNHLLFLHDFAVPFDDNISERDLRKAKNRQKMAGGFRKESGQKMYCSIMSIIETLKKRDMGIIENIRKLFMGTPAIF
ncbi:IS66 family transposase [Bariatricus sp. SGI.154]|uniref:IS66 family transposase n=1 Tax=Bariatricus sp. SGI.154 TaxID=3420549 RepID=UPI003D082EAE